MQAEDSAFLPGDRAFSQAPVAARPIFGCDERGVALGMRCKSSPEIRNLRGCDPTIARSTPMRRRTLTIFPLLIAIAFALFQYFGAEKVTIPDTGRTVRVGMSSEQEQA